MPVLYISIGPCNLSPNAKAYLNLLYCYIDTIFVLPSLGTGQGMSTKTEDKKYMKICINYHKLKPKYGKMPKIVWLTFFLVTLRLILVNYTLLTMQST